MNAYEAASASQIARGGKKRLFLVGARGAGKSTVGRMLAQGWQWHFVDTDHEIEQRTGKTIAQIFAQLGEPEFRRLETDYLVGISSLTQDAVIATGGGMVLSETNRAFFRSNGTVVWLRASAGILLSRIAADTISASRRPGLSATGGLAEVEQILAQREHFYCEVANLTIDTTALSPNEVVSAILAAC